MYLHRPPPDENGWVSTLNNKGYMSLSVDPYTKEFLQWCQENKESFVFEAGAAYGIVTHQALEAGVYVTANDSDERHLRILQSGTPTEHKKLLQLAPGTLPNDIDFPEESFHAIFTSRMMHFLDGDEIELCLEKFYKWLKKDGKLFLVVETPYIGCYASFIPLYERQKKEGALWPGLIEDTSFFQKIRYNNIPKLLHFLDPDILTRVCIKAGFVVQKTNFLNRDDFPKELKLDGRESVGMLAVKK